MTRRFRWRHAGIAAASLLLAAIVAAAFVLGTDTGTRWVLGYAVRFVPGELAIADYDGTLLRGLRISRLDYGYGAIRLSADELTLKPDWLRSNRGRIALRQLAATRISYSSTKPADEERKPLQIAMPALPINISVADLSMRELGVGERLFNDLVASDVRLHGNRIRADRVFGRMGDIQANFEGLDTTLSGDVPMRAGVSWRLGDGPWSGKGRVDGTLAELGFEQAVAGTWPAQVNGTVYLLHRIEAAVDATVRYERWQFGDIGASDGQLQVSGTVNAYRVVLDTGISDPQSRSLQLSGEVSGDTRGLHAIDVIASGSAGRVSARGTLAWSPAFSTDLVMQAQGLDPAQIAALKPGALDAQLRLEARSSEDFALQVDSLTGSYDGQNVNASGRVLRLQDDWRCTACDAALGPNRLRVDGEANADRLRATVRIDAPELSRAYPPLVGTLTADLQLSGTLARPQVTGTAAGNGVRWQDWSVTSFSAESRSSTQDRIDLDVVIDGLQRGDTAFGGGSLRLAGGREAIDSSAEWQLGELRAGLSAVIALLEGGARADVRSASFSEPRTGTWRLDSPVSLALSGANVSTGPQSWENGDARLDVGRFRYDGGLKELDANLVALPLESLNAALPNNIRLAGQVDAELLVGEVNGARSGSLAWKQTDTVIRVTPTREEAIDIRVPVVSADLELSGDAVQGQARLEVEPGVEASLDLATDGLAAESALRAQLRLSGSDWEWITALFPEIDNFKGVITADASANGTLAAPGLQGELRWREGELAVPALNLPLTEIEVTVTGSSAGDAVVKGSATAGRGKLTIDGQLEDLLSDSRSFTAELGGRRALLLNWPDYRLTATPDVVISGDSGGIRVGGGVAVDQATISVRELPEGAVSPSGDVRVSGRTEAPRNRLPVSGELELELGDNVHILAFGLDTNLEGKLRFTAVPSRDPRAEGKLELIGGKFSAYGQDLTIEEGTLTFTGPLDDPIILVRAVRTIDGLDGTVTAGLELRGRAQNVSSSVFSRPAMSEADALSYLVIGRPIEQATAADGSMLSGTAYALGLRQAATITNQLGQNLGLDQLAVGGSSQSTTELVAGKQVNSRLYVRYAYGVFSEIGNLLLRYRLSERLTIEAGTGESQSMDLLYLVEKP